MARHRRQMAFSPSGAQRIVELRPGEALYPRTLAAWLPREVPPILWLLGAADLLARETLGLLCSSRCPGRVILDTYEFARRIPPKTLVITGGFHSPMERYCLDIFLERQVPVILCAGRAIRSPRMPHAWREAAANGGLLVVSPFPRHARRVTRETAIRRNRFVARLSGALLVPYAAPGGAIEGLTREMRECGRKCLNLGSPELSAIIAGIAPAGAITPGGLFPADPRDPSAPK